MTSDFRKQIMSIGIAIGIISVIFWGFTFLLRANLSHQLVLISDLAQKRETYVASSQGLSVLLKDWSVAQQYAQRVQNLVPKKDDLVLLSKQLESRARQKQISFSFSFNSEGEEKTQHQDVGSIGFSTTMEGSIQNILSFLQDLEKTYYALQIKSFDISHNQSNPSLVRCFITGRAFFSI